jgi:hypothetical protein
MSSSNPAQQHVVIWETETGVVMDVNDLIDSDSGWEIEAANCINNHGDIAAWGRYEDGCCLRAVFLKVDTQWSLDVSVTGQGTVDPPAGEHWYEEGRTISVAATPADGWFFSEWQGSATGNENPLDFVMDSAKSLVAVFEEYPCKVTTEVVGSGIVELSPDRSGFDVGESVTITATPVEGWEFEGWQGDLSGTENPLTTTVDDSMHVVGVFVESVPGDLDGDRTVNAVDVQLIINKVLNKVLGIGDPQVDGDVNGDGRIDAIDVQSVINAALGAR